jgi:endonuclease-3 related protein
MKSCAPKDIYRRLYRSFGPQHWWPAKSPFEVAVGAILTQNTSWANVEKAIRNLAARKLLEPRRLNRLSDTKLARIIRPAGYYNIKAKRLKNFLRFFLEEHSGSIKKMSAKSLPVLRRQLLEVNGIGPETADSILLYALKKPVFVVDAYTKRIFSRHRLFDAQADYHSVQKIFAQNLKKDVKLFNEYHALIVRVGKEFCRKQKPRCQICPLNQKKV